MQGQCHYFLKMFIPCFWDKILVVVQCFDMFIFVVVNTFFWWLNKNKIIQGKLLDKMVYQKKWNTFTALLLKRQIKLIYIKNIETKSEHIKNKKPV